MRSTALIPIALVLSAVAATGAYSQPAADGGRKLQASLSGAAEVPNLGDPDGSGSVEVTVNPGQARVCYDLRVGGIEQATAAHIHLGAAGVAGDVKVSLSAPSDGDSSGCVDVARSLALDILKRPAEYYVNVHNAQFPTGALRGQLGK